MCMSQRHADPLAALAEQRRRGKGGLTEAEGSSLYMLLNFDKTAVLPKRRAGLQTGQRLDGRNGPARES